MSQDEIKATLVLAEKELDFIAEYQLDNNTYRLFRAMRLLLSILKETNNDEPLTTR